MSIIGPEAQDRTVVRFRGGPQVGPGVGYGGGLRRERSRRGFRRGVWRMGGAVLALVYSLAVWAALFQGVPRVVAWLGERQAQAGQVAPKGSSVNPDAPQQLP
jgi:hypothetical protein